MAPNISGRVNDLWEVRLDRGQVWNAERSNRLTARAGCRGPVWQPKGRLPRACHPSFHYLKSRSWHLRQAIW